MLETIGAPGCNRTEIYIVSWFDNVVVNDIDRRINGITNSIRIINRLLKVVLSIYILRTS
jgi:hypothetical protein